MVKWVFKVTEQICVGLLLSSVALLAVAAVQRGICYARWALLKREQVIHVTGVHVPTDEFDDYTIYSPAGEFTLSDGVLQDARGADPLSLFAIGRDYRVHIRGGESHTLLGSLHPQILLVEGPQLGRSIDDRHFARVAAKEAGNACSLSTADLSSGSR